MLMSSNLAIDLVELEFHVYSSSHLVQEPTSFG